MQRIGSVVIANWFAAFLLLLSITTEAQVVRRDHNVTGDDGIRLFVREIAVSSSSPLLPILLIHGARVPGVASFDLPVAGGSLAADLAQRGFRVYVMDVRG